MFRIRDNMTKKYVINVTEQFSNIQLPDRLKSTIDVPHRVRKGLSFQKFFYFI